MKFYLYLLRFFRSIRVWNWFNNAPREIEEDEILVRCLVKPIFIKNKLTDAAFLPPPNKGRNDVSVLRHAYMNTDRCKRHAVKLKKQIEGSEYYGLAIISSKTVFDEPDVTTDDGQAISVSVIPTPDKKLKAHADIVYSINYDFTDDEPKTSMRKIARKLISKAVVLKDPNPTDRFWHGDDISAELFEK